MIRSIHCSRFLDRQLTALRKTGQQGDIAASQAERILVRLKTEGPNVGEILAKRTKKGENRVKNCIKYNLGSGYRLITVRVEDRLFVPFLGDHDAADRWLERQAQEGFLPIASFYSDEFLDSWRQGNNNNQDETEQPMENIDLYEEQLKSRLDENLLKVIFQGLYQRQIGTLGDQRQL